MTTRKRKRPSPALTRLQLVVYRARLDAGMTRAAAKAHVGRQMALAAARGSVSL